MVVALTSSGSRRPSTAAIGRSSISTAPSAWITPVQQPTARSSNNGLVKLATLTSPTRWFRSARQLVNVGDEGNLHPLQQMVVNWLRHPHGSGWHQCHWHTDCSQYGRLANLHDDPSLL